MAVHLHRHGNLIAWAKESGLFVRVDRATPCSRVSGAARQGAGVLVRAGDVPCGRAIQEMERRGSLPEPN